MYRSHATTTTNFSKKFGAASTREQHPNLPDHETIYSLWVLIAAVYMRQNCDYRSHETNWSVSTVQAALCYSHYKILFLLVAVAIIREWYVQCSFGCSYYSRAATFESHVQLIKYDTWLQCLCFLCEYMFAQILYSKKFSTGNFRLNPIIVQCKYSLDW